MTRSGSTLIKAADKYLECGALTVDEMLSHFAPNDDNVFDHLIRSKIRKFVITNSHPGSQHEIVRNSDRFILTDVTPKFIRCLQEILQKVG